MQLSNGEESQSLFDTVQRKRLTKQMQWILVNFVILKRIQIESRDQNGWSCWESAHIWDVYQSVKQETLEAGIVLATDPTTTFLDELERDLLL